MLDKALSEEFAGDESTIHRLKASDPHFRGLLNLNHHIWREIQNIQSGVTPASDAYLTSLEKQRLAILDDIAKLVRLAAG
jgi:uncharacterized protein YdcH (DUF465 family)